MGADTRPIVFPSLAHLASIMHRTLLYFLPGHGFPPITLSAAKHEPCGFPSGDRGYLK